MTTSGHRRGCERGCLDAGPQAILRGYAATQWWGFGRFRAFPVDVARPPMPTRPDNIGRVHATDTLDPDLDVTTHRGIPIARPERLILWLARAFTARWGHELGVRSDSDERSTTRGVRG